MKPKTTIIRSGRMVGLLAAGLFPGALHAGTITAHPSDAQHATNNTGTSAGAAGGVTNPVLFVGVNTYTGGYNTTMSHHVVPFQLPDLGGGSFSDVSVTFNLQSTSLLIPTDVNLWALPGTRANSTTLAADVNNGTQNHTQLGTLIKAAFLNPDTVDTTVSTGADENAALSAWLNAAYANGNNSGRFAFVRLSPSLLTTAPYDAIPGADNEDVGFYISATRGVGNNDSSGPVLAYTFTPGAASVSTPTINSFTTNRSTIGSNSSGATLSWSVSGATSLSIDNGVGTVTGTSLLVNPTATTTYTLTASNSAGNATASVTVNVTAGPPPIAHRNSQSNAGGATSTSIAINKPTGAVTGDLLIALISKTVAANATPPSTTAPAGWTQVLQQELTTSGTNRGHGAIFYKYVTDADASATNYTFTLSASALGSSNPAGVVGSISAFSGVNPNTPFDITPGSMRVNSSSTTVTANGITPVTNGSMVVMIGMTTGTQPTWSAQTTTSPGTLTENIERNRNGASVMLASALQSAAGATGNATSTVSVSSISGSILLALKPQSAGQPTIYSFKSDVQTIEPGQAATLSWDTEFGTEVTITASTGDSPGAVAATGSLQVQPANNTTYTLTSTNADGTKTQNVTIFVNKPGPFRYYKMTVLKTTSTSGNNVYLGEFQFMKDGTWIPASAISAPGSNDASVSATSTTDCSTTTACGKTTQEAPTRSVRCSSTWAPMRTTGM